MKKYFLFLCVFVILSACTNTIGYLPDDEHKKLIVNAMMPRWQFAERKLEFMRTRSKESLLLFFLHFHWCKDLKTAEALLDEWTNHPFVQKLGLMNPEI